MSFERYRKLNIRNKKLEELYLLNQDLRLATNKKNKKQLNDVFCKIMILLTEIEQLPLPDESMSRNN